MKFSSEFTNKHNPNFKAKFLYSEDLKKVVDYAVRHKKFEKINTARKNIDKVCLTTRIKVEIKKSEDGKDCAIFTKFVPKDNVIIPRVYEDYKVANVTVLKNKNNTSILRFVMEKIIKMGNNAPKNNLYKKIIG